MIVTGAETRKGMMWVDYLRHSVSNQFYLEKRVNDKKLVEMKVLGTEGHQQCDYRWIHLS